MNYIYQNMNFINVSSFVTYLDCIILSVSLTGHWQHIINPVSEAINYFHLCERPDETLVKVLPQ